MRVGSADGSWGKVVKWSEWSEKHAHETNIALATSLGRASKSQALPDREDILSIEQDIMNILFEFACSDYETVY